MSRLRPEADPVQIDGVVVAVTEKAICIADDDSDRGKWFPRSVIENGDDLGVGEVGPFEVAGWFAEREGLE
jgi:hypothetical protein